MYRAICVGLAINAMPDVAEARDLKIATWNLGAHIQGANGLKGSPNAEGDAFAVVIRATWVDLELGPGRASQA